MRWVIRSRTVTRSAGRRSCRRKAGSTSRTFVSHVSFFSSMSMPSAVTVNDLLIEPMAKSVLPVTGDFFSTSR